jgi:ABC-type dipeptide/oligopeptide/nickel transport system ATPase component
VDECIVIFDNRIVEGGDIKEIIEDPYHPIT